MIYTLLKICLNFAYITTLWSPPSLLSNEDSFFGSEMAYMKLKTLLYLFPRFRIHAVIDEMALSLEC
jgi:hypothetical protein